MKRPAATISLLLALAAPMASSSAPRLPAQTADAAELAPKVGDRLASLPRPGAWHARVHSTTSYMTSDWKPKKTTTAEKIVTMEGRRRTEEILSAVESPRTASPGTSRKRSRKRPRRTRRSRNAGPPRMPRTGKRAAAAAE